MTRPQQQIHPAEMFLLRMVEFVGMMFLLAGILWALGRGFGWVADNIAG